jgi:hypothetical protein
LGPPVGRLFPLHDLLGLQGSNGMSLKWIDQTSEAHKLWQLLVDEEGNVVATVERFYDTMPTYANVFSPIRERRPVSLYDFEIDQVVPSVDEQDKQAREWCERVARPN